MLSRFTRSLRFASSTTTLSPTTVSSISKAKEWHIKGNEKLEENDIVGALESFEKSIWSHPTADTYFNMAHCYYSQGKPEKACQSWTKSIELDPFKPDAHINIANVYALHIKDYEKSLSHYEAAIRISTQDGEIRFNYAAVLEMLGRLKDAEREYQVALKLGVERASQNLRNVKAKMIASKIEIKE